MRIPISSESASFIKILPEVGLLVLLIVIVGALVDIAGRKQDDVLDKLSKTGRPW